MIRLYGINNCGTCRQARRWLTSAGMDFKWHDLDRHGIRPETVTNWLANIELDTLLNKQSKAWRGLGDVDRASVLESPAYWMAARVRLIKRPILDAGRDLLAGFNETHYNSLLTHNPNS